MEECVDDHPDWNDEEDGEEGADGFHEETTNDSEVCMETRWEPSEIRGKSYRSTFYLSRIRHISST